MRRFLRSLTINTVAGGVLAATLVTGVQQTPHAEQVQMVPCSSGRVAAKANRMPVETITLQCYRGRGPWGLGSFAAPGRGASWTSNSDMGQVMDPSPTAVAKTMPKIERLARKHNVPWPSRTARRARDMDPYRLYMIHYPAPSGNGSKIWKYGITKQDGDVRPNRGIAACARTMEVRCKLKWLRKNIDGWYNARKVEAGYALKFKMRFGHCPRPGMKKCL